MMKKFCKFLVRTSTIPLLGVILFASVFSNELRVFNIDRTDALPIYVYYILPTTPIWMIGINIKCMIKESWKNVAFICIWLGVLEFLVAFSWPICCIIFLGYLENMVGWIAVLIGLIISIIMTVIIIITKAFYNIYQKKKDKKSGI